MMEWASFEAAPMAIEMMFEFVRYRIELEECSALGVHSSTRAYFVGLIIVSPSLHPWGSRFLHRAQWREYFGPAHASQTYVLQKRMAYLLVAYFACSQMMMAYYAQGY